MSCNTAKSAAQSITLKTLTKSMLAITLCATGWAHASNYNSVTFFGDSLTDGGYFSSITQGQLQNAESGQFTTNPDNTWATSFAAQLGSVAVANTFNGEKTGNNYAIGGARAGKDVVNNDFGISVPIASANTQVNDYISNNTVDPNGLYVVWAGANDLSAAAEDPANFQSIIGSAVGSQIASINALKNNGANYILVPNVPDIGLTPRAIEQGKAAQGQSTFITNQYNQAMLDGVTATGANIIPLDTFSLLQQIAAAPQAYGFANITDRACGTTSSLLCGRDDLVSADANDSYFFADGIHPTGRAHQMIADYATAVVTAPSQIGLLPHIATLSGLTTNQRLQNRMDQIQISDKQPTRTLWAIGSVQNQDIAGLESNGDSQALLGVDFAYPNNPSAVTGLYANISQKQFDTPNVNTGLSDIELDEIGFGVYHTNTLEQLGGININGAIGYDSMDFDVTRAVTLSDYRQEFKSEADGKRYYASLQAGYPIQIKGTGIMPYLGAMVNRVKIDALNEQQVSGIAMQFDEQKYTTTYGKAGIKADYELESAVTLFADVNYQKRLDDNREAVSARLNTLPDISFETPIIATDDDRLAMTLGFSKKFGALDANLGFTHLSGDDDESTSVFIGLSGPF
ncbi:autotransporter domain-containing protein [Psychrobacter jeotgali]|uniref:autotransporter domain-containing protein n=1 Tax=Psychrobacter jeotgali TaxID=179010 RepID=UPI0019198B1F|nr:autotransporter domain-containing protein [Psychrobacter jeotgali]